MVNGDTNNPIPEKEVSYLIDPANPTGYAQVLEETVTDYVSGNPDTLTRIQYTLGDDVLSQTRTHWTWQTGDWSYTGSDPTQYLLYDGHGSTRQLLDSGLTVADSFNYDGYGVMLSDNSRAAADAPTNLLYAGEQYDGNLDQYYLRARYYNPANGLFNLVDPFAGNMQDPQSLHKYAYCQNNPINGVDPSGRWVLWTVAVVLTIVILSVVARGIYHHKRRDYGEYIGPEIGRWLAYAIYVRGNMAFEYSGTEGQITNQKGSIEWCYNYGGGWITSNLKTSPPSDPKKVQSVTIFGYCVPADVGGNMLYGFIGRCAGVDLDTLIVVSRGGDFKEKVVRHLWFRTNEPEDEAATKFGWYLANKYMTPEGIDWNILKFSTFKQEFIQSPYRDIMTLPVKHLKPHKPPFKLVEPLITR